LSLLTGKLRKQEGIVFAAVAIVYLTIDKINAIADSLQPLDLKPYPDFSGKKTGKRFIVSSFLWKF
jgi:hypothetical protein